MEINRNMWHIDKINKKRISEVKNRSIEIIPTETQIKNDGKSEQSLSNL